ncbi:hypothetical protein BJV82DRAFT_675462 [Fennellomyces sp. T-0311]|nr:hypothetical protein BJV82DRAFT_675462 [Fennellomyces sp. T-0311]
MLWKFVQGRIHAWVKYVDTALFTCHVHKHPTTRYSPYLLVYGQEPCLPGDPLGSFIDMVTPPQDEPIEAHGRIPEVRRLREARIIAERRLKKNAAKDKECWDEVLKPQKFSVGDHVLMRHKNKLSLEFNWKGSFKVIAVNPETDVYKLKNLNGKVYYSWVYTDRLKTIHVKSPVTNEPWYDPTAVHTIEHRNLQAANHIALLSEDLLHTTRNVTLDVYMLKTNTLTLFIHWGVVLQELPPAQHSQMAMGQVVNSIL